MRIAYVITRGDAVGGASIHVRDLASAMQRFGHDARVFVGGRGEVTAEFDRARVSYSVVTHLQRELHPARDVLAIRGLTSALREFRPDVVSTHTAKAGFVGRAAARTLGIPALYTPHGWTIADRLGRTRGRVFRTIEKLAAPWSAAIVNVCEAERQLAVQCGIGRPEQHHVIYNGVVDISPELRAQPGASAVPVRLASVARFEDPKDHATLLRAVAEIQGEWSLDLVGEGPLLPRIRALASELGIQGRVTFHGYLRDPAALLARAHVFVLSSRSEGFPRSILEAMRAGLPVVASNVGGVAEAVTAANGIVVAPGSVPAMRDALKVLMESANERELLGAAGHQTFHDRFRLAGTIAATEMLYRKLR